MQAIIVYEQMSGELLAGTRGAVLCGWQHAQDMATLKMHTEDARFIERKQRVSVLKRCLSRGVKTPVYPCSYYLRIK